MSSKGRSDANFIHRQGELMTDGALTALTCLSQLRGSRHKLGLAENI